MRKVLVFKKLQRLKLAPTILDHDRLITSVDHFLPNNF